MKTQAELLQHFMDRAGKKAPKLERETGIANQEIYRWLSGEREISWARAVLLAPALKIDPEELFPETSKKRAHRLIDEMADEDVQQVLPLLSESAKLVRSRTG